VAPWVEIHITLVKLIKKRKKTLKLIELFDSFEMNVYRSIRTHHRQSQRRFVEDENERQALTRD
jgi:hypothetical protein